MPLLTPKVKDPDDDIAQIAMHGLMTIGYSNETTWAELKNVLFDSTRTLPTRRMALLALVELHGQDPNCFNALEKLVQTEDPLIDSLDPITIHTITGAGKPLTPDVFRERAALDLVKNSLSKSFIHSLVVKKPTPFAKLAYYFASQSSHSPFLAASASTMFVTNRDQSRDSVLPDDFLARWVKDQLIKKNENPDLFLATARHTSPKIKGLAVYYYSPEFEITEEIVSALFSLIEHEDPRVMRLSLVYLNWMEASSLEVLPTTPLVHLVSLAQENHAELSALALSLINKFKHQFTTEQKETLESLVEEMFQNLENSPPNTILPSILLLNEMGLTTSTAQLNLLLPLMDAPDRHLRNMALAAYILFHQGSFPELMDIILERKFFNNFDRHPGIETKIEEYLQHSETNQNVAESLITTLHSDIQLNANRLNDYINASSGTLPPASMETELEQKCRKRSWLLTYTFPFLIDRPMVLNILESSILESHNPNRILDATLYYKTHQDIKPIAPLLPWLLASSHKNIDSELFDLILQLDTKVIPSLEPFLQHKNEAIRVETFKIIAVILPEKEKHLPYQKVASEGVQPSTIQAMDLISSMSQRKQFMTSLRLQPIY